MIRQKTKAPQHAPADSWRVALVILFALVNSSETMAEGQWPFVRGAQFDGHSDETDLISHWPADGPPVLWIRKLGQGYSAFVAAGDRVYTQAQNMTGQYLYCLEADTGKTVWEYRYDWPYEVAGVYPGPRSTPTLYDGRVYFTSPDGLLGCVEQSNGTLSWSIDLVKTYGIEGCDFGYACSPTVIDDMVILPVGGLQAGVVAFDCKSGTELWRATSEPASYSPAFPIELNGEPLVVCYMQNCALILDRRTGQLQKKIALSHGYDEHSAWPIYQEPHLWLSAPFQAGSYLLDLSTLNDSEKALATVWRSKTMSNDVCSSVCVDGYIYGFDIFDVQSKTQRPSRGIFRCIEFATGEVKWSVGTGHPRRSSNADKYAADILQSGIIAADGKLIILNELGELILLEQNPDRCVELCRCTILGGELTWTPPCLNDGRVYVRNQSQAVCVYLGDPQTIPAVATLKVGDLPQQQYYNLAAIVLAVEPEYAFDIPHDRWLIQWFVAGLGILLIGRLLTSATQSLNPKLTKTDTLNFVSTTFLGAIGTTLLGHLTAEFVFTWHICLFAALEYVVATPRSASPHESENALRLALRRRIPLFAFLTVSLLYFLACRRLSLVFEWAFLTGFAGALPFVWLTKRVSRLTPTRTFSKFATSVIGYAFFYATAVAFLKSRY